MNEERKNKEAKDHSIKKSAALDETEVNNEINQDDDSDIENSEIETPEDIQENKEINENNLQEEIEKLRDEKLRLLADMENLRKRSERDRLDLIRYGSINLARDILSPDDNLSRALETISDEEKNNLTVKNLIDGLKMVQKEFSTILEKHNIKKIKALNNKFDHNFHQAMVEIESDDVEEGLVIQEMQTGYTMYDRLLRPSMVGVSKKPSKNVEDQVDNRKEKS